MDQVKNEIIKGGTQTSVKVKRYFGAKSQRGATTTEYLLWAILAVLVVVISYSNYKSGSSENETTELSNIIEQTYSGVHNAVGQGSYGTGNITATVYTANGFPTIIKSNNGSTPTAMTTPWGGTVTVTGNTNMFTTVITGVSDDACIKALTNMPTGWSSAQVDSTTAITSFNVPLSTASTDCVVGGNHTMTLIAY